MLQALLADRFQLKVRNEDKPEPVFALVAAKRVLLKESAAAGDPQCKRTNEDGYIDPCLPERYDGVPGGKTSRHGAKLLQSSRGGQDRA